MQQKPQPNPSLAELKAIRTEIAGLRSDIKKQNLVEQITRGVVLGGILLIVALAILQVFFRVIGLWLS